MEKLVPITNSITTIGQRLKLLRRIMGLTRQQLGELIDYSATNIQYWEEDQTPISTKGCNRILPLLHDYGIQCSKLWLIEGTGPWPQFISAISHSHSCDELISNENEEKQILEEINLFYRLADTITLNILDDGMAPNYCRGDTVGGIKISNQEKFAHFLDTDCIVETADGELFCRTLKSSDVKDRYSLHPHNLDRNNPPSFDKEINYIAPILRVWRRSPKV